MPLDNDPEPLLVALGHAITQWAFIEKTLLRTYLATLSNADKRAAAASFYSVIGFAAKLRMVDAAMEARFGKKPITVDSGGRRAPSPILADWKRLSKRLGKISKKRNHLAHYQLQFQSLEDGRERVALAPVMYNPLSSEVPLEEQHFYDEQKLRRVLDHFRNVSNDLRDLIEQVDSELKQKTTL